MLWLTDLDQKGNDVTIEGQSTTLIALSDFVGNLGSQLAAREADRDRQQHRLTASRFPDRRRPKWI